ncbi:MAG: hypothetical protein AUK33_11130 [Flavobacteriaceae bacterium CG2_30_34_30]|nr:hypothetical protein [Flavobacteriales bacterium]OIP49188.1 MAG: hypothetical protein AUK33_11130 [Flavobacteriaceae bacterium CG2_30_34_30]PIQ18860.1 MAG: hypothetical protein COW66_04205 [Flavobacteriaceae bacterium CG18_big_fil_WC_8_21_14_2_50_34_36]PIZ07009.1 MAG: hypothetical protein COY56_11235 [Flavobacteriaceae bacterium CG_4_10_14_0_8_um_filter_34_31]PJC06262.1 MAG: hypothetical protein CO068_12110 [Flavobacteriaceae bacterium CG_4_9_14_0_8_um_filter_34_30]
MKSYKNVLKKVLLIILFILLIWLLFIYVLPKKFVIQPYISGKVSDTNGLPIKDVVVYRLMDINIKNSDFGYEEKNMVVLDEQFTNGEGIFIFKEVIEYKWFLMPIFKPTNICESILEVKKEGYMNYETNLSIINEMYFHCKNITFEPIIILKEL